MNKTTIWIVIAILIALGLGWWAYASMQQPVAEPTDETGQVQGANDDFVDDSKDGSAAVSATTIRYTDTGFSPATLTIKKGTTVTFINQGTGEMWIASDEHPTHTSYDGSSKDEHCAQAIKSSFDQCGVGQTYSFTFDKAGTWTYHNHREDDDHGTIIVTE